MIDSGHLNAIAFWFDLHLDDEISITAAPACIGMGGEVLAGEDGASGKDVGLHQNPVKARGKSTLQNLGRPQEAAMHPPCSYTASDGKPGSFTPGRVCTRRFIASMTCAITSYYTVLSSKLDTPYSMMVLCHSYFSQIQWKHMCETSVPCRLLKGPKQATPLEVASLALATTLTSQRGQCTSVMTCLLRHLPPKHSMQLASRSSC